MWKTSPNPPRTPNGPKKKILMMTSYKPLSRGTRRSPRRPDPALTPTGPARNPNRTVTEFFHPIPPNGTHNQPPADTSSTDINFPHLQSGVTQKCIDLTGSPNPAPPSHSGTPISPDTRSPDVFNFLGSEALSSPFLLIKLVIMILSLQPLTVRLVIVAIAVAIVAH